MSVRCAASRRLVWLRLARRLTSAARLGTSAAAVVLLLRRLLRRLRRPPLPGAHLRCVALALALSRGAAVRRRTSNLPHLVIRHRRRASEATAAKAAAAAEEALEAAHPAAAARRKLFHTRARSWG